VILSVTEMPREIPQRVAAVFVKSRVSEFDLAETILSLIDDHARKPPRFTWKRDWSRPS